MLVLDMIVVDWIVKKEEKKKSIGTLRHISHALDPLGFGAWQQMTSIRPRDDKNKNKNDGRK